jgi:archaellum component FlaF (FlaF/FlaG flagellin family)
MPVLGPEEPAINKIRNEYIRTIMIKIPVQIQIWENKKNIQKILNSFDAISQYRSLKLTVNVDVIKQFSIAFTISSFLFLLNGILVTFQFQQTYY